MEYSLVCRHALAMLALLFEAVSGHMVLDLTINLTVVSSNKGSLCSNSGTSQSSCIPQNYFAIIALETEARETIAQTVNDASDTRPVGDSPTELSWRIPSWDAEKASGVSSMLITFAFTCAVTSPNGCGFSVGTKVFASARIPLKHEAWNASQPVEAPLAPIFVQLEKLRTATLNGTVWYRYSCAAGVGPKCDSSCRSETLPQFCNGFTCYSYTTQSNMCCDYAISNGSYYCNDMRPTSTTLSNSTAAEGLNLTGHSLKEDDLQDTVIGLAVALALLLLFFILAIALLIKRHIASKQRRRVGSANSNFKITTAVQTISSPLTLMKEKEQHSPQSMTTSTDTTTVDPGYNSSGTLYSPPWNSPLRLNVYTRPVKPPRVPTPPRGVSTDSAGYSTIMQPVAKPAGINGVNRRSGIALPDDFDANDFADSELRKLPEANNGASGQQSHPPNYHVLYDDVPRREAFV